MSNSVRYQVLVAETGLYGEGDATSLAIRISSQGEAAAAPSFCQSLVICWLHKRVLLESRQVLRLYKEANGSGLPRGSFDEAVALQGLDHIVDRGRGNLEVALQVRLRGNLAVDLGVGVDEGQILTLFCGE